MAHTITKIAVTMAAATVLASGAQAGGFSRGSADTDILFDPANFAMRSSVTYTAPTRNFSANPVAGLVGTSSTEAYTTYSGAVKLGVGEVVDCAGTLSQPFGGDQANAVANSSGVLSESFVVNELGLTCSASFDVGPGAFRVLGGVWQETFDYERVNVTSFGNTLLELEGNDEGVRFGLAYEIPEIAFRAQAVYRTGSNYGASGTLTAPDSAIAFGAAASSLSAAAQGVLADVLADPTNAAATIGTAVGAGTITGGEAADINTAAGSIAAAAAAGTSTALPAVGFGSLPQSFEVKLQSGIAPDWLAFGSVKWTDWSVLTELVVNSALSNSQNQYFFRDGWTVSGGIGHRINDTFAVAGGITWDRGVGTGFDISSDTWTGAAGVTITPNENAELRFGGAITYITAASETEYGADNAATDAGVAYSVSGSLAVKF